jgi:hypothetical protein
MSWPRLAGVAAVLLCLVSAAAAFAHHFASTRPGECRDWRPEQLCGGWRLVYNGYGSARAIHAASGWSFELTPRAAMQPEHTHAALAVSEQQIGDTLVSATLVTTRQLRQPQPNPWEVAWLLWHYIDDSRFYAVALKPNGWEISKEDPAYPEGQRFLATGATPAFAIGVEHTVQVRQIANAIEVRIDGSIIHIRDDENPYLSGTVGLYTEDASVRFTDVRIEPPAVTRSSKGT